MIGQNSILNKPHILFGENWRYFRFIVGITDRY